MKSNVKKYIRAFMFVFVLPVVSCKTGQSITQESPAQARPADGTTQLRLCRHVQTREYNPSGHEKQRTATYIRYDERAALLAKLHGIIKELRRIVENKSVPQKERTALTNSLTDISKSIIAENKGKDNDYCPLQWKNGN